MSENSDQAYIGLLEKFGGFHRRRVTPVFTRRNRFRLRWYILHRGKRLRRREVRALRRILEDMK